MDDDGVGDGKKPTPAGRSDYLSRDRSRCNSYNYGDILFWDTRYAHEAGAFDWYQRYSALKPFFHKYIPTSGRVLMVGCGNAVISEDMVNDGYEDVVNVDLSSVVIDLMKEKYKSMPQLKYLEMDVRDMSAFEDESFNSVIDKGTLDSLMCGFGAPLSASQMLGEVNRLLKPGGTYMLISYGDPKVRFPHLNVPGYSWKITLYIMPRPGFKRPASSSSSPRSYLKPVPLSEEGTLPSGFVLEDPDSHYIYICQKMNSIASVLPPSDEAQQI